MTALAVKSAAPSSETESRLGLRLGQVHRRWIAELRTTLEKPKSKERDIWSRWEGIRYVDTVFSDRFDRERIAIIRLAESPLLWVAAELVSALRWQLRSAVGLCHREAEFSVLAGKLVRAVEFWFTTVEDAVGPISWADLPAATRQDLAALGIEPVPGRSELPVSPATRP